MRYRLAVLTATALIGTLLFGPLAQAAIAQSQPQTPGLTLPAVTGALARGGQFSGSLTITRLTNRAGQLVADGIVAGSVVAESSVPATSTAPVVSTPASGGTIFAATSTPAPTSETFSVTSTPIATLTVTPTLTPTAAIGAIVTSTASGEDIFPRASLTEERVNQAPQATAVNQSFREIPLSLSDPDMGACDLLHVDLGVVFVDQLGVQLDLAPTIIDLATLPRANRPLGGLLCTVASLLDLGPSSAQAAMLNELLPIVNRALSTASR